ncbi:MAG TPA: L-histidine N(alpha)-methyltransferase [Pyrinomonadaceae bacterium]|nr:L-histidine N(alpha)-methyltransferase [Pyrinomonadaceae bacterium]
MTQPTSEHDERLRINTLARVEARENFAEDVRRGLTSAPKSLPPKYFYDELGSHLFDAICLLPEYYLTRAEREIFENHAPEIIAAAAVGADALTLVELGSGSATKTRLLIEAALARQKTLRYVPVDISRAALTASARALLQSYPNLSVEGFAADYDSAFPRLREQLAAGTHALVLFLGSNVGNFDPSEAREFLRRLRAALRPGDCLLMGADLKKDAATLEAAYDDALGITAAFNLNLLARINRELRGDFNVRDFRHVAVYNESAGRVEIYAESAREQRVRVRALDLTVDFARGERVHTENSYKYDLAQILRLAEETGFRSANTWLDEEERFSSNLLVAA